MSSDALSSPLMRIDLPRFMMTLLSAWRVSIGVGLDITTVGASASGSFGVLAGFGIASRFHMVNLRPGASLGVRHRLQTAGPPKLAGLRAISARFPSPTA